MAVIRAVRLACLGIVAVLGGAIGAAAVDYFRHHRTPVQVQGVPVSQDATALPSVSIGGPFELVGGDGATVRDSSFAGKWLLVYFGYTTCPDICPTSLQAIAGALDRLGARADRIVPLFITIDPARDRPDVMRSYTALFDRRIVGLTGSPTQIIAAENQYRVYAARVSQPGANGYTMDHTSFIYLMGPDGRLRALFDRTATAASIAAGVTRLLG